MNSSPSRLTLDVLGFAACASMLVGAYIFGVRAWLDASDRSKAIAVETATLIRKTKADRQTQETARQSVQSVEAAIESEGVTLSNSTEITGRLIAIGSLARETGFMVETLSPKPLEPGHSADRQPITLRGTGRYPDCVNLIRMIRESDPTIAVRSMTLRRGTNEGQATLDAELVWFVQPGAAGE